VRLQVLLNDANRDLLTLLADPERRDAGALSNFVTYSRRLKDKLVNFAALVTPVPEPAPRNWQPDEPPGDAAN
jgi:phosphate:Na+ symporter